MRYVRKNFFGFSILEITIAMGILGGLSLVLMNMQEKSTKSMKTFETKSGIIDFHAVLNSYLTDKNVCDENFKGQQGNRSTISSIVRTKPVVAPTPIPTPEQVAVAGQFYSNRAFKIISMSSEKVDGSHINLVINYQRGADNVKIYGQKNVTKKIPLAVTFDTNDKITSCWVEFDTMINQAAELACKGDTAALDNTGTLYVCNHDIVYKNCPAGQMIKETKTSAGKIEYACENIIKMPMNCGTNQYVKEISATGDVTCALLPSSSCPAGKYVDSLDDGTVICSEISTCTGYLIGTTGGAWNCNSTLCAINQYVAGFTSAGLPICTNMPYSACATANQFILEVQADGTIVCADLPPVAQNAPLDYNFIDGFTSSGDAIRKTPAQLAQEICKTMKDYTWNGSQCVPPVVVPPVLPKRLGSYSLTSSGEKQMTLTSKTMCALARVASNDKFKESSYFNCDIHVVGSYWSLKASMEDTNSIYCNATCFGFN